MEEVYAQSMCIVSLVFTPARRIDLSKNKWIVRLKETTLKSRKNDLDETCFPISVFTSSL